jgi:type IV secretory pathway TraG/TraD family ATPase VirD4
VADLGGWLISGAALALVGCSAAAALGGAAASWVAGHGWDWTWNPFLLVQVATDGPGVVWPGLSAPVFYLVTGGLLCLAVAAIASTVLLVRRRLVRRTDPATSLATARQVQQLTEPALRSTLARLRPSFTAESSSRTVRGVDPRGLGPRLGRLAPHGPELRSSWEDVHLLVMAPRAGKTTAFAIPVILDAPGPVLATSNKADLFTDSAGSRRAQGRVWVFDPQRVALTEQQMTWNPLDVVHTVDDARRLSSHFMQEIAPGGRDGDFWSSAALGLLSSLILAAAAGGRDLRSVWEWLNDSADPEPARLLADAGLRAPASGLRGRQGGATETREGIYETARTAAQCLESDTIMRWVTGSTDLHEPQPPPPTNIHATSDRFDPARFDPARFVTSTDTLYLMSKEDAGSAQPLVAALTDQVLHAAIAASEAAGGRLDPPLTCVLDEAANVCKVRELPKLYSHLGSRGISAWTILQSSRQGQQVWSELGMDTLWSAATVKIIGSGLDDPKLADDISRLAGDHDVPTTSHNRGDGRHSTSTSTRRERIIAPDQVRALPKGRALLLATGTPVAMLQTQPWYQRTDAKRLRNAAALERQHLTSRAQQP